MDNIFKHPSFGEVRTAGTPDQPLFCLADICRVLELQPGATKTRLPEKGISFVNTPTAGGEQAMAYVDESNLYRVIMRSNKPQAEAFQDWVCGEVLPCIRKSGGYVATKPDETPEEIMARALLVAKEAIERKDKQIALEQQRAQMAESQVEAQKEEIRMMGPAADYTKEVLQSTDSYTLTQVSKDLGFRSVYAFTKWAQRLGVLYRQSQQWLPNSKYSGKGLFRTRTCKYVKSDNTIGSSMSTVITEAGRAMLHALLKQKGAAVC